MSGGHFDYFQDEMEGVAAIVRQMANENPYSYSHETLAKFREAASLVDIAAIHVGRIDWLVSGDDGEDDFRRRLEEDLKQRAFIEELRRVNSQI